MENTIGLSIKTEIAKRKKVIGHQLVEISRLQKMLDIYNGEKTSEIVLKKNYAKRKKRISKRKKLSPSLRRIDWKPLLKKVLKNNGKPMNTKQLINVLFKGRHESTLKVLKRRMSVVLTLYKNDGTLQTNKNGRGLKYGLPEMFKNKTQSPINK